MIVGAGPAGLIAGYLLALQGYRPLILERGRAVKDRVADVRRFDAGGPVDPESNYLFGEGGAGTFSDGKLTSRSGGPDVHRVLEILDRVPRQAVDRLRASPAPRLEPPPADRPDPAAEARRTGRRGPVLLPGRGPRPRRRPAPRRSRPVRATSRPTPRSWPSATAPATPITCCSAGACRSRPSRSSSASGSSSRRNRSTRPATAAVRGIRPWGRPTTSCRSAPGAATCSRSACAPAAT